MYERIVSLAPSNTEIIYALGAEDKLVACTRYCDYPAQAKSKPRIGGWLDINDELVKSYNPDLILTSTFVQDKITERYRKNRMNIVALMPKTLDGVFESIVKIGELVEKQKEAKKLVESMKNGINEVGNKTKAVKIKPRVYIEEWHKPPTVSGNWVPDLVKAAGGNYRLIKSGEYSKEVTTKQIQDYDPEIIVVSICGMCDKVPREWITKREGWQNLSAVKNEKVFVFDDSLLNRPGPRLVEGLRKLYEVVRV
ncbi:MAG TPA: cobalamin-binding protein [Candidatus Nanoarchaeia archaeon]|nr:cobalamin-binding protein [Candidatus Nanoarchaeia archaeon]